MTRTEPKIGYYSRLLLALALVTCLLLLTQPARAQTDPGISTQTSGPGSGVVGQPYAFTVTVTNNSDPQSVGLKDFLPEGMTLDSVTPSQGSCGMDHHGANSVECPF